MVALGNTPRSMTLLRLEARKAFAFGVSFLAASNGSTLDLTGATVKLVATKPPHQGGTVVLTKTADVIEAALGTFQFSLQSSELNLAPGEYSFTVTLESALDYTTTVLKGAIEVLPNPDPEVYPAYLPISPSTNLAAYVDNGGKLLTVKVDSIDGLSRTVNQMLLEAGQRVDEAMAAVAAAQQASDIVLGDVDQVVDALLEDAESKITGRLLDQYVQLSKSNKISPMDPTLHPVGRPRAHYYNGSSHPLSEYYLTLAQAQVLYPFATSLTDETDWAALQLAINRIVPSALNWSSLGNGWSQHQTALIEFPLDARAVVNKTLTKSVNANKNVVLTSPTPWGARITYTGTDGGRLIDWNRDSVGSVFVFSNLVVQGAGVRILGNVRGLLQVGDGCFFHDTPHPAFEAVDVSSSDFGAVGMTIENMYTSGCAGSVHYKSQSACLVAIKRSRFMFNKATPLVISSIDVLVDDIDFMGVEKTLAEAGLASFIQITSEFTPASHVELRNLRFGSETAVSNIDGTIYVPPREAVVLGKMNEVTRNDGPNFVKVRRCGFRGTTAGDGGETALSSNVAILVNAPVGSLDIDECHFDGYFKALIDEAYYPAQGLLGKTSGSRWGARNTVSVSHKGPIFAHRGAGFSTQDREPRTIDDAARHMAWEAPNLLSADFGTWSRTNYNVSALTAGGPDGFGFFTFTKTGAAGNVRANVNLVQGKRYLFRFLARKSSDIDNLYVRLGGASTVQASIGPMQLSDDGEWIAYELELPRAAATATHTLFIFPDDNAVAADGQTIQLARPQLIEGFVQGPPRGSLKLSSRTIEPSSPVPGTVYQAGANGGWDPLGLGATTPYLVFYDGSGYVGLGSAQPYRRSMTAPVAITNTSSGNDLWVPSTIPASALAVGQVYELMLYLDIQADAGGSGQFYMEPHINGTLAANRIDTVQLAPSQTGALAVTPITIIDELYIDAVGAGGAVTLGGSGLVVVSAAGALGSRNYRASLSIDLSTGLALRIRGRMNTALATNHLRLHRASLVRKV